MIILVEDDAVVNWQKLFGRQLMWSQDFNPRLFPLGVDEGDEVEEHCFDKIITGHEALQEFAQLKREPASLWAQGRYLASHPEAQRLHPLVGIGATWKDTLGKVFFPVFYVSNGQSCVWLLTLDDEFSPLYRFLLRKEKGAQRSVPHDPRAFCVEGLHFYL